MAKLGEREDFSWVAGALANFAKKSYQGLTGNPVWPIPIPPQPVLDVIGDDIEKGPARVGSFVLASLGMVFVGAIGAISEFGKKS